MIRRIAIILSTMLAALAIAPAAAHAATPADVDGTWGSIDIDGSNQVMMISTLPSGAFSVLLTDDNATVCRGGPALAVGFGALRGSVR
jgi:hypothetical protein